MNPDRPLNQPDYSATRIASRSRLAVLSLLLAAISAQAQTPAVQTPPVPSSSTDPTEQKIQQLSAAVANVQAQMEANQKLLLDLQQQLSALQLEVAAKHAGQPQPAAPTNAAVPTPNPAQPTLDQLQERQAIDEAQIATHDLTKVETQSKFPLTLSGMLLFNAFVNTRQVDIASAPAYALPGPGSTGLSLRQTVLGLDASGPHLLGAASHADLRVDFFTDGSDSGYAASGLLRLRTLHATLKWPHTTAFAELDRTLLDPNAPTSLLAVGQPELAWAGNLWYWNPQVGLSHDFQLTDSTTLQAQAALIDPTDPQIPGSTSASTITASERSRWPGLESRFAFRRTAPHFSPEIGIGGYFSPHRAASSSSLYPVRSSYSAWAATVDLRLPLARHFELTASAYRGQALGGLGGGGYTDYLYKYRYGSGSLIARGLDDIGGWAQLKARASTRLEFNSGYGIDNPFAAEIHSSLASPFASPYQGLARNRAFYANTIYSPSAYLLFSLEYRRLWSNLATGPTTFSDVIGIGAGYKF